MFLCTMEALVVLVVALLPNVCCQPLVVAAPLASKSYFLVSVSLLAVMAWFVVGRGAPTIRHPLLLLLLLLLQH